MATNKTTPKVPAEPVNSEQAELLERQAGAEALPAGPTPGELEERTVEAENRAEAAEGRVATLEGELDEMKRQIAALMRAQRQRVPLGEAIDRGERLADGDEPIFDESAPHGLVVGDDQVAYVQDGHQFGRDKRYLATEKHRGVPRAFNPRLVGWTKPRGTGQRVDPLEGFRPAE